MDKGKLFVLSGPSGAGKGSVVGRLTKIRDDVCFSVSVTTRKPRPNEVDGKDYFFIESDVFDEMVKNGELLEHAVYVSNKYGTPKKFVEDKINQGINVILDIEVQGARQVHSIMPQAVFIFFIPPSIDDLRKRLEHRGTETAEAIEARLLRAKQEFKEADFYDYIVINDDIDTAVNEFSSIITAEKCSFENRVQRLETEIRK